MLNYVNIKEKCFFCKKFQIIALDEAESVRLYVYGLYGKTTAGFK